MGDIERLAKEVRELIDYGCRDSEVAEYIQNWQAARTQPCRFHGDDTEACETYSGDVPCEPEEEARASEGEGEAVGAVNKVSTGEYEFFPGSALVDMPNGIHRVYAHPHNGEQSEPEFGRAANEYASFAKGGSHNGEQGGVSEADRDALLWAVYDHVAERFDFNKDPVLDIIGYLVDAGIVTNPPTEREGE